MTNEYTFRSIQEFRQCTEAGGYAYFDTLTYNDFCLPIKYGIPYFRRSDVTNCLKKLRQHLTKLGYDIKDKLTYFVSSEYGGKTHRPHYHIIFYNSCQELEVFTLRKYLEQSWTQVLLDDEGNKYFGSKNSMPKVPESIVNYFLSLNHRSNLNPWLYDLKHFAPPLGTPVTVPLGFLDDQDKIYRRIVNDTEGVIQYVAKYCFKDDGFRNFIKEKQDQCRKDYEFFLSGHCGGDRPLDPEEQQFWLEAVERWNWFIEQGHQIDPFHQSSLHFGEYFLESLSYEDEKTILNDGLLTFKNGKRALPQRIQLPKYYERKLYYKLVRDEQEYQDYQVWKSTPKDVREPVPPKVHYNWILNERGILRALDLLDKSVREIETRLTNVLNNAPLYDEKEGIDIKNIILHLLDGRTLRELAEYLFVFKNRLTQSALSTKTVKEFYEDSLRCNNVFVNPLRGNYDVGLKVLYDRGSIFINQDYFDGRFRHFDDIFDYFCKLTANHNKQRQALADERQRLWLIRKSRCNLYNKLFKNDSFRKTP